MKPNSFGETIRRIEAERKAEAEAAIDAGWTEADHPEKCCPHLVTTPQPKRAGRSLEDLERLRTKAAGKATWWEHAANRAQAIIDIADAAKPRFDHGMLNTPIAGRQRGMNAELRRLSQLSHAKERAGHFTRLTLKYQDQIQKRKS